jgi:hypothetical protein
MMGTARARLGGLTAGNKILQAPEDPDEFHVRLAAVSSRIEAPRTRDIHATVVAAGAHVVSQATTPPNSELHPQPAGGEPPIVY